MLPIVSTSTEYKALFTTECIDEQSEKTLAALCMKVISLLFVSFSPQVVLVFALSIGALGIYFIDSSE